MRRDLTNTAVGQQRQAPHVPPPPASASLSTLAMFQRIWQETRAGPASSSHCEESEHFDAARFEGPVENTPLYGSVCVDRVHRQETRRFLGQIALGFSAIYSLLYQRENLWPVAATLLAINLISFFRSLKEFAQVGDKDTPARLEHGLEMNLAVCFVVYAAGFLLLFLGLITSRYFLYFSLPYLFISICLFFLTSDSSFHFNMKRFSVFEALQLLLIAAKFTDFGLLSWPATLLFFRLGSFYLIALGFVLVVILLYSLYSSSLASLQSWKVNGIMLMIWNHVLHGATYVLLMRAVADYYEDDGLESADAGGLAAHRTGNIEQLVLSCVLLIVVSLVSAVLHLLLKDDVKKYLANVIYKQETQKKVLFRLLTKSYSFKLVRVSAHYFVRGAAQSQHAHSRDEEDLCAICFQHHFDILIDPCGHSGICYSCLVSMLRRESSKCPFCKHRIQKMFYIRKDREENFFRVGGEFRVCF